VVVQAISSPVTNAVGVLGNVTVDVTYYIYPNGKIYVHSVLRVAAAQNASEWRCATLGLSDPTSREPYSSPDSTGWIRSSTTQNPYSSAGAPERYIFAYWRASTTPAPYTNFTKASVLLVPRPGNPKQGQQGRHNWGGWKRWYYGNVSLNLSAGQSLAQDYLIQLGTQGSSVLPDINSSAVASPIAQAYFADPTPPPASSRPRRYRPSILNLFSFDVPTIFLGVHRDFAGLGSSLFLYNAGGVKAHLAQLAGPSAKETYYKYTNVRRQLSLSLS
jgi:hypothetical protein